MARGNGKALTREELLTSRRIERVDLDGFDKPAYVQPLPFAIAQRVMRDAKVEGREDVDMSEHLDLFLIYGVVDADGNRIFADEDRDKVYEMPFGPAQTLSMRVMKLSGMTRQKETEGN